MIQKKVCLLGSFAVGKTSLVMRYVSSMFDEKYLTTIGVKVDKKQLRIADNDMQLMIWDLAGEDGYNTVKPAYLRGSAGYILVVDGTRPQSVTIALELQQVVADTVGDIPGVIALNKADLTQQWALDETAEAALAASNKVFRTSAKTGVNVELLFSTLAEDML